MGASLHRADMSGADLGHAKLQGSQLLAAKMLGADLQSSKLSHSVIFNTLTVLAKVSFCRDAFVKNLQTLDGTYSDGLNDVLIERIVDDAVIDIPDVEAKNTVRKRMRNGIVANREDNAGAKIERMWAECERYNSERGAAESEEQLLVFLRNLACDSNESRHAISKGIARNWISKRFGAPVFSAKLAGALLEKDEGSCASLNGFEPHELKYLRKFANPPADEPVTNSGSPQQ